MPHKPRTPKQRDGEEFRFKIDAYSPEKIPMLRLAEYMEQLAHIMGETAQVHFDRIAHGSTVIVSKIEREAVPKVRARVSQIRSGNGPSEAQRAYDAVNRLLRWDDAVGDLRGGGAVILPFPGRNEAKEAFESVRQQGFIDGRIVGVRGADDTAHVILKVEDKQLSGFSTTRTIAKELAKKWDETVRLIGKGRWLRDNEGNWSLIDFKIDGFEPLDDTPLSTALAGLRAIPTEWDDDAYSNLDEIRHGPKGTNGRH
jgi:hypothetical protein